MTSTNSENIKSVQQENTFIFVILGSSAAPVNEIDDTSQSIEKKYSDYSLISDAVVIRRLAKRYISPDHIFIFAHGTAEQFKINDITKDKLFFQLNLKEIYVTNPTILKFLYMI